MAGSDPFLIYGATGYTGRLLARTARERGLRPVLGGRNEARLARLAADLELEYRVASLDEGLDAALGGMKAVIHAAGPFLATFRPMRDACLRTGTHYLDVSGELATFEALRQDDARALQRRVMLMPGVGFDVVPSDCLAAHVARRVRGARRLVMGISGLELISRGSLRTLMTGAAAQAIHVRRGGVLVPIAPGSLQRELDYGAGPRRSVAMNWADLVSAWYSTGIEDIEVYFEANPTVDLMLLSKPWVEGLLGAPGARAWADLFTDAFPEGPPDAQRVGRHGIVVVEVEDGAGRRARSRLRTPEAYGFTCTTALAIAERVLAGDLEPGFQTPSRVYGPDFILAFEGVTREDL